MAYFDSSKNRALWEIRLTQLRKEREAREAGMSQAAPSNQPAKERTQAVRIPVSYQELLKAEAMESGKKREKTSRERSAGKEKAAEKVPSEERRRERESI